MVPVQTGSIPRPETKRSSVFRKIPDLDLDCRVWSSPDWVPIGPGPNFPNTIMEFWAVVCEVSNLLAVVAFASLWL